MDSSGCDVRDFNNDDANKLTVSPTLTTLRKAQIPLDTTTGFPTIPMASAALNAVITRLNQLRALYPPNSP
ncbi:MAG: hypothetical protein ABIN58_03175, partial [candidate division WOR-3 bacterium]